MLGMYKYAYICYQFKDKKKIEFSINFQNNPYNFTFFFFFILHNMIKLYTYEMKIRNSSRHFDQVDQI